MKSLTIGSRKIDADSSTFVIAEIGVNHDGSIAKALELVEIARHCGADAVKLQIFRASTLMHNSSSFAAYQSTRCEQATAIDMLQQYELSTCDIERVVSAICSANMIPIATPFSVQDVSTIERLNLSAIKIASPDLVNRVLLERVMKVDAAILVSTGASTMAEVGSTAQLLGDHAVKFALLHCISSYPTIAADANLRWISELATFNVPVGFSDHTTEPLAGAFAVAAGARIVEKHLTYDQSATGPDHAASANPVQFAEYIRAIRLAQTLIGQGTKRVLRCEQDVRVVSRQSLVLCRDIAAGDLLAEESLIVQRPGTGISAADFAAAAGRRARTFLKAGTLLQWDMLTDAA